MAVSVISPSPPPWMGSRGIQVCRAPSASLSLFTGSVTNRGLSTNCASNSMARPPLLYCSFLSSSSSSSSSLSSLSLSSSFSGLSLGLDMVSNLGLRRGIGFGLVVTAGKAALCQTKRNRSRKSLARTHGFRRRMRTTSGRAVLKHRRAKGRWVLCTKSYPHSGKGA